MNREDFFRNREPYLEFTLYTARCNADGVSEGTFDPKAEDEYSKKRFMDAMGIVQKYLSYKEDHWVKRDGIIQSEEDAQKLIEFAQKNIERSESIIQLIQSIHGHIVFQRVLKFKNYDYPQVKEVSDKLRGSGIGNLDIFQERSWFNILRSYG